MRGNVQITRYNVVAAGPLEAHDVPGVIDFDFLARHHDVNQRSVSIGIGAAKHHPV